MLFMIIFGYLISCLCTLLWVPEALGKPSVAAFALFSAKLVVFHLSLLEERDVIYPEL